LVAGFLAAFVAAHVLADALGAWGSVLAMAALVALVTAVVADRGPRAASPVVKPKAG